MHKGHVPVLLRPQKYHITRAPVDRDFQHKYRRRFGAAALGPEPVPAIIFFTASYDVEVDLLSIALAARNATTIRFDVDHLVDMPVLYDPLKNLLYREGLTTRPRAIWARLWHTESLRVSDPTDTLLTAYQRDQWRSFADEMCTAPVIHHVNGHGATGGLGRLAQLRLAQEIGFGIPRTVVSTDPARAAQALDAQSSGYIVVKSLGRHFVEPSPGHLIGLFPRRVSVPELQAERADEAPVMYQEYIEADAELRVYSVYDDVIGFVVAKHEPDAIFMAPRGMRVQCAELSEDLVGKIRDYMHAAGAHIAGFDFIEQHDRAIFLEANFSCDWRVYEVLTGSDEVSSLVAHHLSRLALDKECS